MAAAMVRASVAVPVPAALVAPSVTLLVPVVVGVPVIRPVVGLSVRLDGRFVAV